MSRHERVTGWAAGCRVIPRSAPPLRTPDSTSSSGSIRDVRTSSGKRSVMSAVSRHNGAGATVPTRSARV